MADCEHGSDDASCPVCLAERDPEATARERLMAIDTRAWGRPFIAKKDGHCRGCNLPISPGQEIRQLAPVGGHFPGAHYVHVGHEGDPE